MRKLIGTIAILLVLYAGLFGIEQFNIEPFIMNWIKSDDSKEIVEDVVSATYGLVEDVVDSVETHIVRK